MRISDWSSDVCSSDLVPLSHQTVSVLRALWPLTGACSLVFPNNRHPHRPMSENAIGYLLNRAGYHGHHVPHGFRASFSTIMNERSEEHTSELQSLMRISYAVFCLKKKTKTQIYPTRKPKQLHKPTIH